MKCDPIFYFRLSLDVNQAIASYDCRAVSTLPMRQKEQFLWKSLNQASRKLKMIVMLHQLVLQPKVNTTVQRNVFLSQAGGEILATTLLKLISKVAIHKRKLKHFHRYTIKYDGEQWTKPETINNVYFPELKKYHCKPGRMVSDLGKELDREAQKLFSRVIRALASITDSQGDNRDEGKEYFFTSNQEKKIAKARFAKTIIKRTTHSRQVTGYEQGIG
ncbi:hypothetical protein BD560DRAFT_427701 [Blakeslea trispora]|nr:hypothetical protein BD560DRAFT_427701 [Blakeslea trispora]